MKLAVKLTAALVLAILVVMAGYAYVQVRQEIVLSEADLKRTRHVALAWLGTLEAVWEREGPSRVRELVERANARATEVTLRLLALDAAIEGLAPVPLSAEERQALRAGEAVRNVQAGETGREERHFYKALETGGEYPVALELIEPVAPQLSFIRTSHRTIALATLAIVAACALLAAGIEVRLVGRPLELLRNKARRAGDGDFSGPLELKQDDEIGELAAEINAMCDRIAESNRRLAAETEARLAALEQLRHTDRLATVGRLAAGVAHELGTPLGVISARGELIAATAAIPANVAMSARIVVEQADRVAQIVQQLLDFSRRHRSEPKLVDLRHVVAQATDLLSSVAERRRVTIDSRMPAAPLLAYVDRNQLQQSFTNVVLNGIQAMPDGGVLRIDAGVEDVARPTAPERSPGRYFCVHITDSGVGIAPDQIANIFEPFFTTKPVGEGTGLGLAVTHGIVAEHGGWIDVESEVGRGTRFRIFLPVPESGNGVAAA